MPVEQTLNLIALALSGAMSLMLAPVLNSYTAPLAQASFRQLAGAWWAQAAYYLVGAASFLVAVNRTDWTTLRFALSIATQVANVIGAALLVLGTVGYARRKGVDASVARWTLVVAVGAGIAIALTSQLLDLRLLRQATRAFLVTGAFAACTWILHRHRRGLERRAQGVILAFAAFALANTHYVVYWMSAIVGERLPYSIVPFTLIDPLLIAGIATALVALGVAEQRNAAEATLRSRERSFREMIENSNDLIAVFDAPSTIRYVSPAVGRILGWGDEVVGKDAFEFVHPDDREAVAARSRSAIPPEGAFQLRMRSKLGNWVRMEAVSTRARGEDGEPLVIVNARDMSERERFEASLREAQKLESIGRLAGGVAHDLNNVLTVISGHAQLTLEEAPPELRDGLQQIDKASGRAASLTRQLLAFARRQVIQPQVFDVAAAVRETAKMASRLIPESIELHLEIAPRPSLIDADPSQIEQVVLNLMVNARDAIADRGLIEIEVGETELSSAQRPDAAPGRYVVIRVRDSGAGIPEHVRPHLFEPFFTTKAAGEGTGLGLATSYGIVKQAGGFITVDSVVGTGSTFSVFLPAVANDERPLATEETSYPRQVREELVLVAEDDSAVRELTARVLRRAGFTVMVATNGVEALQLVESGRCPRILVTDAIMPKLGGVALAQRLSERCPGIRTLLLSGYPGEPDVMRSLPKGTKFLQKPVSSAELVRNVLELAEPRVG